MSERWDGKLHLGLWEEVIETAGHFEPPVAVAQREAGREVCRGVSSYVRYGQRRHRAAGIKKGTPVILNVLSENSKAGLTVQVLCYVQRMTVVCVLAKWSRLLATTVHIFGHLGSFSTA